MPIQSGLVLAFIMVMEAPSECIVNVDISRTAPVSGIRVNPVNNMKRE